MTDQIRVTYRIETPGSVEAMAGKIAADQSTGTFTDLPGETEALKARHAARVERIDPLPDAETPGFPVGAPGPFHRADVTIAWPLDAIGTDIEVFDAHLHTVGRRRRRCADFLAIEDQADTEPLTTAAAVADQVQIAALENTQAHRRTRHQRGVQRKQRQ